MSSLRKITVHGQAFLWKYTFDDYDCWNHSRLFIKSAAQKGQLIVHFQAAPPGYCPFNEGVPAVYRGEPVVINLNRPRFAAEILAYALEQHIDFQTGVTEITNGLAILKGLGYDFSMKMGGMRPDGS